MEPLFTAGMVKVVGIYRIEVVRMNWMAIIHKVEIVPHVERLFLLEILCLLDSVNNSTWFEINAHITARVMLDDILVFNITSIVSLLVLLHSTTIRSIEVHCHIADKLSFVSLPSLIIHKIWFRCCTLILMSCMCCALISINGSLLRRLRSRVIHCLARMHPSRMWLTYWHIHA